MIRHQTENRAVNCSETSEKAASTAQRTAENASDFEFRSDNRSISPLVGVVLLVGGTILLAAAVGPFIFSVTDDVGEATPDTELRFAYSEDVDFSATDSYGTTGNASGADGLLTIMVEDGDKLEADHVNVTGGVTGGALTDGNFSSGDTLGIGDTVTVWANRSDEVEVVWNDQSVDESTILNTFTVFPLTTGTPGLPEPDYNCDGWSFPGDFDSQPGITAGSGDLTVNGVVLKCDLSKYSIDNVNIINSGANIGNVEANSDVTINDGATYDGFVNSTTNDIYIRNGSSIDATTVKAHNNVDVEGASTVDVSQQVTDGNGLNVRDGSTIQGDATLGGSGHFNIDPGGTVTGTVTIDTGKDLDADSAKIGGDIILDHPDAQIDNLDDVTVKGEIDGSAATNAGKVVIQNGTTVEGGGITTHGEVKVTDGASVNGDIDTTGQVIYTSSGDEIDGNVTTGSDINWDSAGDVSGSLNVQGNVDLVNMSIGGMITATGNIGLDGETNVSGHVFPGGSLTCNDGDDSTIAGVGCTAYKNNENFAVTIDSTNSAIEEGQNLTVTATVENTWLGTGTQQITFEIEGEGQKGAVTHTIDGHNQVTETFEWSTTSGDSGSYVANVSSEDDYETTSISVQNSLPSGDVVKQTGSPSTANVFGSVVEFDIENTGVSGATVTHIALNGTTSSTAAGVYTGNGGLAEVQINGTDVYQEGNSGGVAIGGSKVAFDSSYPIPSGSTATVKLTEFVDKMNNGGSAVDMSGEDLALTLFFADGSSRSYTFSI